MSRRSRSRFLPHRPAPATLGTSILHLPLRLAGGLPLGLAPSLASGLALALALALALVASGSPATAQTQLPELLFDLDTIGGATLPLPDEPPPVSGFVPAGERVLFLVRHTDPAGWRLWGSDGTAAGTGPVWEPCDGRLPCDAGLLHAGSTDQLAFFWAGSADGTGLLLLRSDGTRAGTFAVTGPVAATSAYAGRLAAPDLLLFSVCSAGGQCNLWRSDGTTAGTREIGGPTRPWHGGATLGDVVLFAAFDPGGNGLGLWRSDGSRRGTQLLRRFGADWLHSFVAAGRRLFFMAGEQGGQLWVSDGTAAATRRIGTLAGCHDRWGCATSVFGTAGDRVFLHSAGQLWRSDGTRAGTVPLGPSPGLGGPLRIGPGGMAGERAVLLVAPPAGGSWRFWSAGLDEPRLQPITGCAGACPAFRRGMLLGQGAAGQGARHVYLATTTARGRLELWSSDGTGAGTRRLAVSGRTGRQPRYLATGSAGRLTFLAIDLADAVELWVSDGTPQGTRQVATPWQARREPYPPLDLVVAGGRAFFAGWEATRGLQPWSSDGTPAGTTRLATVTVPGGGSAPRQLTALPTGFAFRACDGATTGVWASDGVPGHAPALLLAEHAGCAPQASEGALLAAGGRVFFAVADLAADVGVRQLWASDGSPGGTQPLTRFADRRAGDPFLLAGRVHFFAHPLRAGPLELWQTDGTPGGTSPRLDLPGLADPQAIHPLGETAYFAARDEQAGLFFFATDGTAEGTRRITPTRLVPLLDTAFHHPFYPPRFTRLGDHVYFALCPESSGPSSCGLWRTRGTVESSELVVADPTIAFAGASPFAVLGERLYFVGHDGIWRTDGTAAGTTRVTAALVDWHTGAQLTVVDDRLYFVAHDARPPHRRRLWVSDGTPEGTARVPAATGGEAPVDPLRLRPAHGRLWLTAADSAGRELWSVSGQPGRLAPVADLAPGPLSSAPAELAAVGPWLLFSADDATLGREPWLLRVME